MNEITKLKVLLLSALFCASSTVHAYGMGGGGSSTCQPTRLTAMMPEKMSIIKRGDHFSFIASNVLAYSVKVDIKQVPAVVKLEQLSTGRYQVSGDVPEGVPDGYARINVKSKSASNCDSVGGWLVIVGESPANQAVSE